MTLLMRRGEVSLYSVSCTLYGKCTQVGGEEHSTMHTRYKPCKRGLTEYGRTEIDANLPEQWRWLLPQRKLRCTGGRTGRTGNRDTDVLDPYNSDSGFTHIAVNWSCVHAVPHWYYRCRLVWTHKPFLEWHSREWFLQRKTTRQILTCTTEHLITVVTDCYLHTSQTLNKQFLMLWTIYRDNVL